jgi:Domain of unknown function (DUF4347)
MTHKTYNDGLILVYVSAAAPQSARTIYNDGKVIENFEQLVSDVQTKSGRLKVGWLRIVAHGSAQSISIGTSKISATTLENHKTNFEALSNRLTPNAVIELYSCKSGLDNALLLAISNLLRGRAVLAYKEKQSALNLDSFKWKGDAKVCMSQICYTLDNDGRPKHSL